MALPSTLRVVGRDATQQQFQFNDSTRAANSAPPPDMYRLTQGMTGLAGFITDQFILMRRHRDDTSSGWSARLLRALRAFNGIYEPDVIEEIKRFGGSSVYARIIAQKCRGTSSLLRDVYLGADRPWSLEAPTDPQIPQPIMDAINQLIQQEVGQAVQQHLQGIQANRAHLAGVMEAHRAGAMQGIPPHVTDALIPSHLTGPPQPTNPMQAAMPPPQPPGPPPPIPQANEIRDRFRGLVEDARNQAKRIAVEQAKIAEDKIEEILAEGNFYTAFGEFLVDLPLFPYGVIKGPTVRIKTEVRWNEQAQQSFGQGRATVINVPKLTWERVSPFDIYWTPGAIRIEDANIIERTRLTRSEINDMLDLPGYNTDEVRAVLDEYGRGGLVDNWDQTDAERAILENRENPRFNQSGMIACLEYQGHAQGRYLLEMGMDPRTISDPLRDYFINAWLIGRHVVKVQQAPSPRKRHQYYVTSFEKIPGSPVGNGLPDLLADIQSVANATLRALVNNLSIASGPQVLVNDDRLGDGEDGESMYPWKRWHVKTDPFGNNQQEPITFFQPQSNSGDLLNVYTQFSTLADEASAIPRFLTGVPPVGGLGRTASGLSMLIQNSSKILQTVASNIDRDIMQGVLDNLMDMVLLTDQTGLLNGEEKVRVLGVNVAVQRDTQRARQEQFLQMTMNPIDNAIIGPQGRAQILRSVADGLGLPGEDIVPSEDKMKEMQQQAQQAAAQQGQVGHSMGPPGQPGAPGSPAPGGAGQPPQMAGPTGAPGMQGPAPPSGAGPRTATQGQTGPSGGQTTQG